MSDHALSRVTEDDLAFADFVFARVREAYPELLEDYVKFWMDPHAWAGTVLFAPDHRSHLDLTIYDAEPQSDLFEAIVRIKEGAWLATTSKLPLPDTTRHARADWPSVSAERRTQAVRVYASVLSSDADATASCLDPVLVPWDADPHDWRPTHIPWPEPGIVEFVGNWSMRPTPTSELERAAGWIGGTAPHTLILSNHDGEVWPDSPVRWARLGLRHF